MGGGSSAFLPSQILNEVTGIQESSVVTRKNKGKGKRSPLAHASQGDRIETWYPPIGQDRQVEAENSLAGSAEDLTRMIDGPPEVNAPLSLQPTENQAPLRVEYNLPQDELSDLSAQAEINSNQDFLAQMVDGLLTNALRDLNK